MVDAKYLDAAKNEHIQSILRGLLVSPRAEEILKHFVKAEFISTYLEYRCRDNNKARSLIGLAVTEGNLPLLNATITVCEGACGALHESKLDKPLRKAVKKNNVAMVRGLLFAGADPEANSSYNRNRVERYSTSELARPNSKAYKIIRAVVQRKACNMGDRYVLPTFQVWDKEK